MGPSIATRYARRMSASRSQTDLWAWPRKQLNDAPAPDPRLLKGSISGLTARIEFGDGHAVDACVRAVSQHDLVLTVEDLKKTPVKGQLVSISVCLKGDVILDGLESILHWAGNIHGVGTIAAFTVEAMGSVVNQWQGSGQRGEIRFPVDAPAALEIGDDRQTFGRIVDYSLSGCRLHCAEEIELSTEYETMVLFDNSTIDVDITPRWVLNSEDCYQLGCTFKPEQGVLMACRHHAQPTGLSLPLKPQTTNWEGTSF